MYKVKKQALPAAKSARTGKPASKKTAIDGAGRSPLRSDSLDRSIGYSLRRAQFSTYTEFTQSMEPFDVRPSQFTVLAMIRSNPGLTQSAICSALGIQKTNFVALLDKLEFRGLAQRRKVGNDRRSFALHLTSEGQSLVGRMEAAHDVMESGLTQRLGVKRTRQLLALLHEFTLKAQPAD